MGLSFPSFWTLHTKCQQLSQWSPSCGRGSGVKDSLTSAAIPVDRLTVKKLSPQNFLRVWLKNALDHTLYNIPGPDFHFQTRWSNSYQIYLQYATIKKPGTNAWNNTSHDKETKNMTPEIQEVNEMNVTNAPAKIWNKVFRQLYRRLQYGEGKPGKLMATLSWNSAAQDPGDKSSQCRVLERREHHREDTGDTQDSLNFQLRTDQ